MTFVIDNPNFRWVNDQLSIIIDHLYITTLSTTVCSVPYYFLVVFHFDSHLWQVGLLVLSVPSYVLWQVGLLVLSVPSHVLWQVGLLVLSVPSHVLWQVGLLVLSVPSHVLWQVGLLVLSVPSHVLWQVGLLVLSVPSHVLCVLSIIDLVCYAKQLRTNIVVNLFSKHNIYTNTTKTKVPTVLHVFVSATCHKAWYTRLVTSRLLEWLVFTQSHNVLCDMQNGYIALARFLLTNSIL